MPSYNGHPSYAHWNVALWIGSTESLYRLALDCLRETGGLARAAERFYSAINQDVEGERTDGVVYRSLAYTPDGVRYGVNLIRHALRGLAAD